MTVAICSGYFQRFHEGHKTYIKNAIQRSDRVIVIVNNDRQQRTKYKEFENLKSCSQIAEEIREAFPTVHTVEAIDKDCSVCKTLNWIYSQKKPGEVLMFCKDADRNLGNIPEAETLVTLGINLLQFQNKKENSSTEIMREEANDKV